MIKHLLLALCLFTTAGACKKKDEAKPATTETKPAEGSGATTPTEAPKPTEAPPAGGAKIADQADYEAKGTEFLNKLIGIFQAGGKDCDKIAADMSKFLDDNKALFDSIKEFEKANPDAEKQMNEKMKGRQEEMMKAMMPAMEACKDHKGLEAAMSKIPE